MRRSVPIIVLSALALAGVALAWLANDAPVAVARGWFQADALSALALIVLGSTGLAGLAAGRPQIPQEWLAAALFGLAALSGHLALGGGLLIAGGVALVARGARPNGALVGVALAALGLILVGGAAGEWRYGAPAVGAGLSSVSFALLLLGALTAADAGAVVRGHPPGTSPVATVACLYTLLRLFSLGPWNLGWLFAAIMAGGALALAASWQAAAAPPDQAGAWLGAYLAGLAIAGAGLGSGAGVTLAGYALLTWPIMRLGLAGAGGPGRLLWPLAAATPLTAPFMLAWMAVAAAVAGGLTLLAAALWAAALLATLPVARLAAGPEGDPATSEGEHTAPPPEAQPDGNPQAVGPLGRPGRAAGLAAGLSVALGVGAPLVIGGLLGPVAAQLQGGLTPFGELELWPWAGLLALDAARQPVATMPSVALVALMLILVALCWVALRLRRP